MMIIDNKKDNTNSNTILLLLYFFQYGLLIPITVVLGGQYPIAIFTFLLFCYALLNNRIIISSYSALAFLFPLSILVLKLPFEHYIPEVNVAAELIISFGTIGLSGILIGSINFSQEKFINYGFTLGIVNFLLLCIIPFTSLYMEEVNYMRFGYAILPSVIFSFLFLFRETKFKKINIVLFLLSLTELLIFGARGAMLTFLLFAFIYLIFISDISKKSKSFICLFIVLVFISLKFVFEYLIEKLTDFGLYSYALTKYLNIFNGDSLASTSSGRDDIYQLAINRIEESVWIGSPLNTCYIDTGSTYYHNVVLDVLVNFGIIGFLFFLFFLFYNIFKVIRSDDKKRKIVFFVLIMVSMGRLFVSSSFWQRPEFWMFVGYCVNYNYEKFKSNFI